MNFEKMTKEELIKYIEDLNENKNGKLGLVWDKEKEPEKIVEECDKQLPILKEQKDKFINAGGINNILIQGDNFHALTVLNYTHEELIDIIYIDPPYNRGKSDFIYNDEFIKEDDGYKHSKWLNFMSKRLLLAKKLLKETGVLFISIDDNEMAQLKLLCDQIFDINNCLGVLPTIMNLKGNQDEFGFAGTHEYTLVYAKNKRLCELGQFDVDEEEIEKNWLQDEIGYYKKGANLKSTGVNAPREKRPNLYFPIYVLEEQSSENETEHNYLWSLEPKDNYVPIYPITNGKEMSWRWSKKKFTEEAYDVIVTSDGKEGISFYKKQRPSLGDIPSRKPKSVFYKAEYSSGNGTSQITNMFGKKVFDNPKPIELIKDFIYIGSRKKDAVILDFFAGSGTTGHAVLELNEKDNGSRKFILCTNNENNICDAVTYPRIEKVIKGYTDSRNRKINGISSNLKYYETDFVSNTNNRDQLYYDLTEKCIPMLSMKEDCYNEKISTNEYKVFVNDDETKATAVYFNLFGNTEQEFIDELKKINMEKVIYKFSLGDYIDPLQFSEIDNYRIEPIPYKIVEVYRKLIKISKGEI